MLTALLIMWLLGSVACWYLKLLPTIFLGTLIWIPILAIICMFVTNPGVIWLVILLLIVFVIWKIL